MPSHLLFRRNTCQESDRTLLSGFATNVKSSPFGLTRKIPSDRIGTQQSAISRLEDADYEGHSLSMLQAISQALNQRLEVHLVPINIPQSA